MTIQEAREIAYAQAIAPGRDRQPLYPALAMRIKRGEADTHPLVIAALAQ